MRRALLALASLLILSACRGDTNDGRIAVALIGEEGGALFATGPRLSFAAQQLYAATHQGLVRFDEGGQLVPGIAERWIVTDDGMSYIFRIREYRLPDGKRITARMVRQALEKAIKGLEGTSLGLDLAPVRDVRAMTGRVVEIRLTAPMPGLLQLLAQPELGISIAGFRAGPMAMRQEKGGAVLTALAPQERGLPRQKGWGEGLREVHVVAMPAEQAVKGFSDADYQLVLGGTLATLPLADPGPLSRGTIRLDSAIGLFGFDIRNQQGFLADPSNREALAMALDREKLIQPFNIGGWSASTRIVPSGLQGAAGRGGGRWDGMNLAARRKEASARVARWKTQHEGPLVLRISLPKGPGSDILFTGLASQWRAIGVDVRRVGRRSGADLALRDRVARFAGARWFLDQFHCGTGVAICSPEADTLLALAVQQRDQASADFLLARAENALLAANGFIPIGAPIRWSLARANVQGFMENPRAFHPLFPLSRAPI